MICDTVKEPKHNTLAALRCTPSRPDAAPSQTSVPCYTLFPLRLVVPHSLGFLGDAPRQHTAPASFAISMLSLDLAVKEAMARCSALLQQVLRLSLLNSSLHARPAEIRPAQERSETARHKTSDKLSLSHSLTLQPKWLRSLCDGNSCKTS